MAEYVKHTEELANINKKIISKGEILPSVRLKDGTTIQTGTIGTMLVNVKLYNSGERDSVKDELRLAIPTLIKLGIFDLFSIDEWMSGDNPGRHFVGECAKTYIETGDFSDDVV